MVSVQVRRCKIFDEFTGEQQHRYFGISLNKTVHHIDTLYYSVFLNEPEDVVKLQSEDKLPANLARFLQMLRDMKANMKTNPGTIYEFGDMESSTKVFSMYEFCVSMSECFDIFISSYLPNEATPRVVVQLRSRYLVLEGVLKAVEESFAYLKNFLAPYGLFPVEVRENRIDYAYHTNLIQSPYKFFSDDCLVNHLKTNLRNFKKYGKIIEDGIELETLALGNRKSNNIYWRGYNKCQEVIRQNYKAFFIQYWRDHGLISEFDQYVYQVAYEMKSYRTGVLVGRLRWYLDYGTDDKLKAQCRQWLESNYIKSDNNHMLEKRLHNVIPEPTLIFNIEYQVKRKFYTSCGEWLGLRSDLSSEYPEVCKNQNQSLPVNVKTVYTDRGDPLLRNLFLILSHSPEILDYLTGYGNVVSFASDRRMSLKDFLELGEPYMAWWKRLRSTPINYALPSIVLDFYRKYDVHTSMEKTQRNIQGQIARLAMLNRKSVEDRSFVEDMADVLCILNDNDVQSFVINQEALLDENGEQLADLRKLDPKRYSENRRRRARQLKGVLRKSEESIEEESDPGADTGEVEN